MEQKKPLWKRRPGLVSILSGLFTAFLCLERFIGLASLPENLENIFRGANYVMAVIPPPVYWSIFGGFLTATLIFGAIWLYDRGTLVLARRRNRHDDAATESLSLGRQPINRAFEYLLDMRVFREDGNQALQIANLLRQSALDGELLIWGSEPSSIPIEWHEPFLIEIDRDYWRHHEIDAVRLMEGASDLPEKGCTALTTGVREDEGYWHLHVDMNQVRSKWSDDR